MAGECDSSQGVELIVASSEVVRDKASKIHETPSRSCSKSTRYWSNSADGDSDSDDGIDEVLSTYVDLIRAPEGAMPARRRPWLGSRVPSRTVPESGESTAQIRSKEASTTKDKIPSQSRVLDASKFVSAPSKFGAPRRSSAQLSSFRSR
eukprot:TRINITY_DN6591_c0_g1_i1.p1 TRINITY_DN6591_c0_g1~~TRINITY_DN6591_c0_g1_i1.p1  ORF type:complete len:150 (+),score=23.31 TRINITY_DN6591_c0_g1_i1:47-496(+)